MKRSMLIWVAIIIALLGGYGLLSQTAASGPIDTSYSRVLRMIDKGDVRTATLKGDALVVRSKDGQAFAATTPISATDTMQHLQRANVDVTVVADRPTVLVDLAWLAGLSSAFLFAVVGWPASRFLKRLGFSPWAALWFLVPGGLVVGMWIVASAKWPIEEPAHAHS